MDHLRDLRLAAGLTTQALAATEYGVGLRTWSAWETGERDPPRAILEALEIRAHGFAVGAVRVPIVGRVRAGASANVHLGDDMGRSVEVVPKTRGEPLFAVEVRGQSMAPEIRPGDILVCRLVEDDREDPGAIVIADLGECEYVVKRLRYSQGVRLLDSIADGLPPITQQFRIHAKVVEIRRPLERR